MKYTQFVLSAAALLALPLLTTGCSTSFSPNSGSGALVRSNTPLAGKAMGGQQPISGTAIYLMAAGSGNNTVGSAGFGYGAAAQSLLTTGSTSPNASPVLLDGNGNGYVLTTASGGFDITGSFTCPAQNAQVYLVAQGGDATGAGMSNSAIVLLLALGNCGNLANQSFISINELSTVAAVTALQQFIGADAFHIGSSSGNLYGLQNAMLMAGNLVNLNYGVVVPSSATVINPTAKLFTLADAMAACVNSTGPTSAGCAGTGGTGSMASGFLTAAYYPPTASGTATDTFAAMTQIARYPAYNPQIIINTIPAISAFGNAMMTAPNDFSLAVAYQGGGLGGPFPNNNVSATAVAIDAFGGAWVAACGLSCGEPQQDTIVEVNPYAGSYSSGYILSGTGGYGAGSVHNTQSLVIDQSNAVYSVNDPSPGFATGFSSVPSITILSASGTEFTNSPITNASFIQPEGIVIDQNGLAVVADAGNGSGGSVYSVSQAGTVNPGYITSNPAFSQLVAPTGIAIDTNGAILVNDTGGGETAIYANAGNNGYNQTETQNGGAAPTAVVVTSSHRFWALNPGTVTVSKLTEGGALVPCTGICAVNNNGGVAFSGSTTVPNAVSAQFFAVDGTAELLVPACSAGCSATATAPDSLVIFSNTGGPVVNRTGLQDSSLANPVGIAVDGSGNTWVSNGNTGAVTEFVGIASPVLTPIASALQQAQIAIRP